MVVNIDTERLQEMVGTLQNASNDIDRAAELLQSITTHHNWACKERYTINDHILENRAKSKKLQEDCQRFCAVAKQVADDFVETESGISQMFPGVEGAIAAILASPVSSVVINGKDSSTSDHFASISNSSHTGSMYQGAFLESLRKMMRTIKQTMKPNDWPSQIMNKVPLKDIVFGCK